MKRRMNGIIMIVFAILSGLSGMGFAQLKGIRNLDISHSAGNAAYERRIFSG